MTGKSLIIPAEIEETEQDLPLVAPGSLRVNKESLVIDRVNLLGEIERATLFLAFLILDLVIRLPDRVPELIVVSRKLMNVLDEFLERGLNVIRRLNWGYP